MEQARFIEVDACVRYWDDAYLNGKKDVEGKIPLRDGDCWRPVIELATGRILKWPEGVEAKTCYKVSDGGEYWLLDAAGKRIAKWTRLYAPARFFDVTHEGIATDYLVLNIGSDGRVAGWQPPLLDSEQWAPV